MKAMHAILVISLITLIGMVGIYVGAWYVYNKYQTDYKPEVDKLTSTGGTLSTIFGLFSR